MNFLDLGANPIRVNIEARTNVSKYCFLNSFLAICHYLDVTCYLYLLMIFATGQSEIIISVLYQEQMVKCYIFFI